MRRDRETSVFLRKKADFRIVVKEGRDIMERSSIDLARVQAWQQEHLGNVRVVHLDSTLSTNDDAWQLLDSGENNSVMVLAEEQRAGRGRMGRKWQSPRGAGIWFSFGWVSRDTHEPSALLGLVGGIAAADAIRKVAGVSVLLKWPNDLMIDGKKVGGVLAESRRLTCGSLGYVMGIGINCLQEREEFEEGHRESATSLALCGVKSVDRTGLVIELLRQLSHWLQSPQWWDTDDVRREWSAKATFHEQRVLVHHDGRRYRGWMVEVDPVGELVVRLDGGNLRCFPAHGTSLALDETSSDGETH